MAFCGDCGTNLCSMPADAREGGAFVSVRVATSVGFPRLRPSAEVFCDGRLGWLPELPEPLHFARMPWARRPAFTSRAHGGRQPASGILMEIQIEKRFAGPPRMGHGGYVSGLFADRMGGTIEVTLRKPTPLDQPLQMNAVDGGRFALQDGETLIADARPATLDLQVPPAPNLAQAKEAEAGSPSLVEGRGAHPICFGCGSQRAVGDALRIFVGPCEVEGHAMVAGGFHPVAGFGEADGLLPRRYVLAALDCPGAFAFIVDRQRAGLLGRIVFEQYRPVPVERDYIVTAWQIGRDGRKLFAGSALFEADGQLCAAARATWFEMTPRRPPPSNAPSSTPATK
ncbi:MAG: GFA family protein [Myxococcales bacterium]|nr:GFA family protein [Myxococcales bacterium]